LTRRIVFLLEERSMKFFLEGLLPRIFPGTRLNESFICVTHEGKQDLERSLPRKLRAWNHPDVFIIIRDQDTEDCQALKERLFDLCKTGGKPDSIVRIACRELEAWYLGDPDALAAAFENPALSTIGDKARYRDPDTVATPSRELSRLEPKFQKLSGARLMATHISRENNRSNSFRVLLDTIRRIVESPKANCD